MDSSKCPHFEVGWCVTCVEKLLEINKSLEEQAVRAKKNEEFWRKAEARTHAEVIEYRRKEFEE